VSTTRRTILESILHSAAATVTERLKAAELIEVLDARDPDARSRDFYSDLEELDDEILDELLGAVSTPVLTLEARAQEVAREIIASDERFRQEVERVARDLTAAERDRAAEVEQRLADAERRLEDARAGRVRGERANAEVLPLREPVDYERPSRREPWGIGGRGRSRREWGL
jgi:hypothetical protein